MNAIKLKQITLTLAAMFQVATLVSQLARKGQCDDAAFEQAIRSIFIINAEDLIEILGPIENLYFGLNEISKMREKSPLSAEIARYVVSLMYLEKRFSNSAELKKTLSRRIQQGQSQVNYFSYTHTTVINTLAEAFLQTLGSFHYRIQVVGDATHLRKPEVVAKIRALLLAGVRMTVLWRQLGGSKWQLLWNRGELIAEARNLLT